MTSKVFFTYLDWTLEAVPRVFYVGKGQLERVNRRERDNAHWRNIVAKHGWRREVILATKDEAYAFEQEILGILELGTFENGRPNRWGANKTAGGEGSSGFKPSKETIEKNRASNAGPNSYWYGKGGPSHHAYGRPVRESTRSKHRGENNSRATLIWVDVAKIRLLYSTGKFKLTELAPLFGVTPGAISKIVTFRTWKITMKAGDKITIVSGSRLRRISEDGKRLLDQTMQEGAIVEYDTGAKVTGVIASKDGAKNAVMLEVVHDGKVLTGWCFPYELVPVESRR